ncbi:hypothetical protein LV84_02111 [Algoriphagus ratkowskyi]|uniref:Uncharacterized protein n=1 Tax=Algoriphagus ratkowskyi TaxID=57028 RepID=A0A2W7RF17_9BACT|nr:hypothetical protein LV84_02111 [Algoriphagus ratkowskyi]
MIELRKFKCRLLNNHINYNSKRMVYKLMERINLEHPSTSNFPFQLQIPPFDLILGFNFYP